MSNPANGPISVSAPGKSLTNATGGDVTFNTKFPFAKLDSTNIASFQIITLFFNTEPPNPPADGTWNKTLIYSFAHGYSYTPSSWFLISLDNFASAFGAEGAIIHGSASGIGGAFARVDIEVDATNVNFYISKNIPVSSLDVPNIIGMSVSIRSYIFVEDLLGLGVPTHV